MPRIQDVGHFRFRTEDDKRRVDAKRWFEIIMWMPDRFQNHYSDDSWMSRAWQYWSGRAFYLKRWPSLTQRQPAKRNLGLPNKHDRATNQLAKERNKWRCWRRQELEKEAGKEYRDHVELRHHIERTHDQYDIYNKHVMNEAAAEQYLKDKAERDKGRAEQAGR